MFNLTAFTNLNPIISDRHWTTAVKVSSLDLWIAKLIWKSHQQGPIGGRKESFIMAAFTKEQWLTIITFVVVNFCNAMCVSMQVRRTRFKYHEGSMTWNKEKDGKRLWHRVGWSQMINLIKLRGICVKSVKLFRAQARSDNCEAQGSVGAGSVNCIKLGLSPLWNFKLQTRSHFRDTWTAGDTFLAPDWSLSPGSGLWLAEA